MDQQNLAQLKIELAAMIEERQKWWLEVIREQGRRNGRIEMLQDIIARAEAAPKAETAPQETSNDQQLP